MSRPATSRLKVNPPLGMRPSLEFRRVYELRIDPSYQRSISSAASRTLIRRIAQFWDWSLCQPLAVAKREDGGLYVVDGQHRLEGAKLRNDIHDLPCVVTACSNVADEAASFIALNQQRRPLTKIDLFKAALAGGDSDAIAISLLLDRAGLTLARHSNLGPGTVSNIVGIQSSFRAFGEKTTGAALIVLARAFKGEVLSYAGTIYPGIAGFIAGETRIEGKVDGDRLVSALQSLTQKQWVTRILEEQAMSGDRRQLAAKTVIAVRYKASGPVSQIHRPPPPPASIAPTDETWCEQCDRRVSGAFAASCASPFCKVKAVAP